MRRQGPQAGATGISPALVGELQPAFNFSQFRNLPGGQYEKAVVVVRTLPFLRRRCYRMAAAVSSLLEELRNH
jgi:hypothetical protein